MTSTSPDHTREARSPAKLILSGEHSVVAGCPALALALDPGAAVRAEPLEQPALELQLPGQPRFSITLDELPALLNGVRDRHRDSLEGKGKLTDVCPRAETLIAAAVALAAPAGGLRLSFPQLPPIGIGLGSSAAILLAVIKCCQPELDGPELFTLAHEAENFQHGRSSGLDIAASLHGGLVIKRGDTFSPLPIGSLPPLRLYHTGTPAETTGQCVQAVQSRFPADHPLWKDFTRVTEQIIQLLTENTPGNLTELIRENHRLLHTIGVVPPPLQQAIKELEAAGCAAKLCGAGALTGDKGGMLLVCGDPPSSALPAHWREYPLQPARRGTRMLP